MTEIYEQILAMKECGQSGVLVTVIERTGHGPAIVGKKLLLTSGGNTAGTVGGGLLEYAAMEEAKKRLHTQSHHIQTYIITREGIRSEESGDPNLNEGSVTLFFEYLPVTPTVYLFGAGHVGQALIYHLGRLDYRLTVMDDRPTVAKILTGAETPAAKAAIIIGEYAELIPKEEPPAESYVVIAGYNHEIDYTILRSLFLAKWQPRYIGLLASPRKAESILRSLRAELGEAADLSRIFAPIGLNIGGQSPEEIAISIIAEIQAVRHGKMNPEHQRTRCPLFGIKKAGDTQATGPNPLAPESPAADRDSGMESCTGSDRGAPKPYGSPR